MARMLVLSSYGVRVGIVDAADAGIGGRLRRVLPPTVRAELAGIPDVTYSVQPAGARGPGGSTYDIVCGPDVRLQDRTADEVVEWLRTEIDAAVAIRSRTALGSSGGAAGPSSYRAAA